MKFKCPGMASEILYQPALPSLYKHINPARAYQTLSFPECLFESVTLINPTSSWDSISLPQFLPYLTWPTWIALKIHFKAYFRDFLGGPVVKTPHFHWKGCGLVPWSKKIQHAPCMAKEKGIFHFASISSWPLWQFSYSRAHSVQFSSVQSPSRVRLFATPI